MKAVTRSFSELDQERFAQLSGDRNPLHLDALAARRSPFGKPVVHGVHLVLWALDAFSKGVTEPAIYKGLKVSFSQACLVGDNVNLEFAKAKAGGYRIVAKVGSAVLAEIELLTDAPELPREAQVDQAPPYLSHCAEAVRSAARYLSFEDIEGDRGTFMPAESDPASAFPAATAYLGVPCVSGLLPLSTVVGMYCPGHYSLFSGFIATITAEDQPSVSYRVTRTYASVRQVLIKVRARSIDASVRAASRHGPVQQPSFNEMRAMIAPNLFRGRHALIVGGSRGLGEATAKIIAAGGGIPRITYVTGRADAERIADDIRTGGGLCELARLDVREAADRHSATLSGDLTSMYYFATTSIFRKKSTYLDVGLLEEFFAVYVAGFADLCAALSVRASRPVSIFYPSSVAVYEPVKDLFEYAAAKSAGEVACAHIPLNFANLRVYVERLPRIMTDQTATVLSTRSTNAAEIMRRIASKIETV